MGSLLDAHNAVRRRYGLGDAAADWPADHRPGISEAELFQGYSGLADGHRRRSPAPIPTPETVRAIYRRAAGVDDVDEADVRDEVAR
jgi:hypothetical protein